MDEKRLIAQLQRLKSITNEEWIIVSNMCKTYLSYKLKNKTGWGIHSESFLGVRAFDYYFIGAVEKLYNGTWTWFYEKYKLEEQIIRIMNSMISENVRKAGIPGHQKIEIIYDDEKICSYTDINEDCIDEEDYTAKIQTIKVTIQDDPDLSEYFCLVLQGNNSLEISKKMNIPIDKVYKLTEKIKTVTLKKLNHAK